MLLNNVEKEVVKHFLEKNNILVDDEAVFFSDINVESRDFSGVGFITNLERSDKLKFNVSGDTAVLSKGVGANLNTSIDTGYIFYVENNYITAIEGFTSGEEWPNNISKIDTYDPVFIT